MPRSMHLVAGIQQVLLDDLHQLERTDFGGNGKFHGECSCFWFLSYSWVQRTASRASSVR